MFNKSVKNSFTLSFDIWTNERNTVHTQLEYQVDIGSAQKVSSPKYLIVAHQTAIRIRAPNKANEIAVFDNLNVRKDHVGIDGVGYPRDGFGLDYALNDYVYQYRVLKLINKEYVGEELLNLIISYTDRKNKYLI